MALVTAEKWNPFARVPWGLRCHASAYMYFRAVSKGGTAAWVSERKFLAGLPGCSGAGRRVNDCWRQQSGDTGHNNLTTGGRQHRQICQCSQASR